MTARALQLEGSANPLGAWFSPDNGRLAAAVGEWEVVLWDVRSGERLAGPLPGKFAGFSPDARTLAICDRIQVRLIDAATGGVLRVMDGASAAFRPEGLVIAHEDASEPRCRVEFRDAETGARIGAATIGPGVRRDVLLSLDGTTAAFAGKIWDVATGRLLWTRPHVDYDYKAGDSLEVAFSRGSGRLLVGSGYGRNIAIYDSRAGTFLGAVDGGRSRLEFSADGRTAAHVEENGAVVVWNAVPLPRLSRLFTIAPGIYEPPVRHPVQGKDFMVAGGPQTVCVIDLPEGTSAQSVALSDDGLFLGISSAVGLPAASDRATLPGGSAVEIREAKTGTLLARPDVQGAVLAFSRDAKFIAVSGNGHLRLIAWSAG